MPKEQLRKAYLEGYLACLYDYAWWKDGEMFVGSTGKAYKTVAEPFQKELDKLKEALEKLNE